MGLLASTSRRALVLGLASVLGCTNEYASVDLDGAAANAGASGGAAQDGGATSGAGASLGAGAGSTSTGSAGGGPSATASSSVTGPGAGGAGGADPCPGCEIPVGASSWVGTYVCGQGLTSVDLDVTREPVTNELAALYSWYPHPSNPGVPDGSFTMAGSYDPVTQHVVLTAVGWVVHPANYGMVDLDGYFEPQAQRIAGDVIFPNCDTFEVFKQ